MDVQDQTMGPPVMSPEFLRRAERVASSPDPDLATAETVQLMCRHIRTSARDPLVRGCATDAVDRYRGGPLYAGLGQDPYSNPGAMAESCWWWAKENLRFVHHSKLIYAWLNERDQLQLLISPDVLVRMPGQGVAMVGDCAIYTMLICAFLDVLGVPWEIVTIACNPRQPAIWSHVFPRVVLPGGRRVTLDASHGKYPGWQVPREQTFRLQAWASDGRPVEAADQFEGLHDYVFAAPWSYPGMGDAEDGTTDYSGTYVDTSGATAAASSTIDSSIASQLGSETTIPTGISTTSTNTVTVPSSSNTSAWAAFLTQMAKSGMTLAELEAIPAGTVLNATTGSITRQATGYPVGTSTSLTTSLSGTNLLMYGGLAVLGLLAISSMRRS